MNSEDKCVKRAEVKDLKDKVEGQGWMALEDGMSSRLQPDN